MDGRIDLTIDRDFRARFRKTLPRSIFRKNKQTNNQNWSSTTSTGGIIYTTGSGEYTLITNFNGESTFTIIGNNRSQLVTTSDSKLPWQKAKSIRKKVPWK